LTDQTDDRATEAFHRLLTEAAQGGQAKVDALIALAQRTVWVGTWGPGDEGFRTLTNSDGASALPIFTSEARVEEAADRFGWRGPDGQVPMREVGARQALRHAVAHNVQYVVVDIAAPHALDIERSEIEPMLTPEARRDSTKGTYAGHGRVSSSMMQAVKATPPPGSIEAPRRPPPPPQPTGPAAPRIQATTDDHPSSMSGSATATFGSGGGSVTIGPLATAPTDALLDGLSEVLRSFPEVEWAALGSVSRGPADAVPTVLLRVDTGFRQRVNEIVTLLRQKGDDEGASLDVLLLDDPQLVRSARSEALVFFPWRR